ncbi:MAG: HAD hydrolase-like protein [Paludibacteraceae bacterium]|nr:HAD hydrolase-like protein [Paludibacteraceae bacterium]
MAKKTSFSCAYTFFFVPLSRNLTFRKMVIIFDLDGTLINTIDDLGQACNHALAACGFPTHKIEDYPRLVGNGINRLIERALPEEHRNEQTVLRIREYFVPFYDKHNCNLTRPYEGITELLHALKSEGHYLAVASNKYQAATEKIVAQLFPSMFDVVLGERENVARKPDPQIIYDVIKNYELRIENDANNEIQQPYLADAQIQHSKFNIQNCLYVGDSLVDANTARAAGCTLVLCTWGFEKKEHLSAFEPDYLINHPKEIIEIVHSFKK